MMELTVPAVLAPEVVTDLFLWFPVVWVTLDGYT